MNIVITGASRGIGKELVKIFRKSKDNQIIISSRNIEVLKSLEDENVHFKPCDLTIDNDLNGLVNFIKETFDKVDILINNAGVLIPKSIGYISRDDFKIMNSVNFEAPFFLIQSLLSSFRTNAHIVNISSMGGFQGSSKYPGLSVYSSTKAAIACLSECLSIELADQNIKVNALALGAAQTEMLEMAFPEYKAPVSAAEMADYVANFALNGHNYFNGQIIPVTLSNP